jgi:hypothetical protein
MTFYARRWARRIRDNDDDAADPTPAIRAIRATMTILANPAGAASRRHAHVAIRGPPRRPATRNTPRPRLADPSARSRAIVRYAMR